MLSVMCYAQPGYVPQEHFKFIDLLEFERIRRKQLKSAPAVGLSNNLITALRDQLNLVEAQIKSYDDGMATRPVDVRDRDAALTELVSLRKQLFNTLADLMVRKGMGDGWAQSKEDADWAAEFIILNGLRESMMYGFRPGSTPADLQEKERLLKQAHGIEILATTEVRDATERALHSEVRALHHKVQKSMQSIQSEVGDLRGNIFSLHRWISEFSITGRAKRKAMGLFGVRSNQEPQ